MAIYVMCPPRQATGGIELLHQLTHELNSYDGIDARIWYRNHSGSGLTPDVYGQYENLYVTGDSVPADSVVVIPEIWATSAKDFRRPCVYWESVDNYWACSGLHALPKDMPSQTIHLTQSEYAKRFLLENGIGDSIEVSDYLNDDYFCEHPEVEREPFVLYNPKKGMRHTVRIFSRCRDIKFMSIENMTRADIISLMHRGKVYIDFGNHPGKDRIPREAAMCGLCVITGRDGSAKFFEDVSIPEEYKIDRENIGLIEQKIRQCIAEYDVRRTDFDGYRNRIRGEKDRFKAGVRRFIDRIT